MRIVVVEDNISVAKGICYQLQDAGHAVDMLHDGAQADLFLRDDGADMVVLDINLPGKDGLSILRAMRERGDRRPVLMLTAQSETTDKVAGLDARADDYLAKPFEMVEFSAHPRPVPPRRCYNKGAAHCRPTGIRSHLAHGHRANRRARYSPQGNRRL